MPPITPHESDAEFITPEDVENDVAFFTEALLEKQIQRLVRELVRRSDIYIALRKLVTSGRFANEVEALAQAVQTLQSATGTEQEA